MNEYLTDGSVERDCREGVTRCYLVLDGTTLVGYFGVLADAIRLQKKEKPRDIPYETAPALKLGRMGVAVAYSKQGVGTFILQYVTGMAEEMAEKVGLRYVTLDAEPRPGLVPWYEKRRFVRNLGEEEARGILKRAFNSLKKGEKLRQTSMRLDLMLKPELAESPAVLP